MTALETSTLYKNFGWAFRGLKFAYITQKNFRIQLVLTIFICGLGYYYQISQIQWLWISLSIILVLIAELFNTALEHTVDLISRKKSHLAMMSKDISASAVLLSAIHATIAGTIIFYPHIKELITTWTY